jgi:hypothetical protein
MMKTSSRLSGAARKEVGFLCRLQQSLDPQLGTDVAKRLLVESTFLDQEITLGNAEWSVHNI